MDTQDAAQDLVDRIDAAIEALWLMCETASDNADIATDGDVNVLTRVLDKLERTESAWRKALELLDHDQELADAQDERDTYDSAYGPEVQ